MKLKPTDTSSSDNKLWNVMNDLEMVTSKIASAREIIDAAIDRIQEHQYDKAETLLNASHEFLGYYLEEFDDKFKLAWQETVVKQKYEPSMPPWGHSDLEYQSQYPDEVLNDMCDAAEGTTLTKNKTWVVPIEEDHLGEYYVTFPNNLVEQVGWEENDTLEWVDNKDGSFSIKKVEN
jgi:hypothetical protein